MNENEPLTVDEVLDAASSSQEFTETIEEVVDQEAHLIMDTPFSEYTVTEGLLLLIFLFTFLSFFLNLSRR